MSENLATFYRNAKEQVVKAGYQEEIEWTKSIDFDEITEKDFLIELAYVILSSGMRSEVVNQKFSAIEDAFFYFESAEDIARNKGQCGIEASKHFNHIPKIDAIITGAEKIYLQGWESLKTELKNDPEPLEVLKKFPYIGPVTCYHLAKNIGLTVAGRGLAKPDRWLVKIAKSHGYKDVQAFCAEISRLTGDSVPVVDTVLWRYSKITHRGK